MISMESLAPSLEPEPEEPTYPGKAYGNSSHTTIPATSSIPDDINFIRPEPVGQVTTSIEASAPKPPAPRTIHGVKWGIAGENAVLYCRW